MPTWAMAISSQCPNLHSNYSLMRWDRYLTNQSEAENLRGSFWHFARETNQWPSLHFEGICWPDPSVATLHQFPEYFVRLSAFHTAETVCFLQLSLEVQKELTWAHSLDQMTMTDNTRPLYKVMNGLKGTLWSSAWTFSIRNHMRDSQWFILQLPPTASSHAGWKWGWWKVYWLGSRGERRGYEDGVTPAMSTYFGSLHDGAIFTIMHVTLWNSSQGRSGRLGGLCSRV